jgi:hypothetical protein
VLHIFYRQYLVYNLTNVILSIWEAGNALRQEDCEFVAWLHSEIQSKKEGEERGGEGGWKGGKEREKARQKRRGTQQGKCVR